MALYYLNVSCISRRKGKSAVSAAAYIGGKKFYDKYYGLVHDFTHRKDIFHTEILLPPNAPNEFYDPQILWNAAEIAEKREDSRLAREVRGALPNELKLDEDIDMIKQYVINNFVEHGMCAFYAIHSGINKHSNTPNPHTHILLTTRKVTNDGFFSTKCRDWDKREHINTWREQWANAQNREFERKGLEIRLSHESYIMQGINREPSIHLGRSVIELERRGIETDRGKEYHAIKTRNQELKEKERLHQLEREKNRTLNQVREISR